MTTYAESTKRPPDFEVRYRFYSDDEGGRKSGPPFQHYRCDWAYEGDDISKTGIFMIWPEFLDSSSSICPDGIPVPATGIATMWVVNHRIKAEIHQLRIREGVRGFFMEGNWRVAEAVVVRVIGLHTNSSLDHL